jgi:hypothetical protein
MAEPERTQVFDFPDKNGRPVIHIPKALVMLYAIVPEDLSNDFGYIRNHPVYESIRNIKTSLTGTTDVAVVGLIDLGNGRTFLIDYQTDHDREISLGPYFGNLSATHGEILQGFLQYSLDRYASGNTKTLFWWLGHGNGYQPRLDIADEWEPITPKDPATNEAFSKPILLKRK